MPFRFQFAPIDCSHDSWFAFTAFTAFAALPSTRPTPGPSGREHVGGSCGGRRECVRG